MRLLKKFIDLLLYGHLWIAGCALAHCLQTQLLLFGVLRWGPLPGFVFFATLLLYSLHRIISLQKVHPTNREERFRIIAAFKRHILLYAGIAASAGAWFFFQLDRRLQLAALVPILVSLGYVIPFLGGYKRLRDLDHLKIFLIAIVWAWVTVGLPAAAGHWTFTAPALLMLLERMCFIFALCIPFDIRDLKIDAYNQVKTLPGHFGIAKTKWLSAAVLLLSFTFAWLNYHSDVYSLSVILALGISLLITLILTLFSDRIRHDYYFTGVLDGMMILQFVLVWLGKA